MKRLRPRSPLRSIVVVALLVALPFLCSEAQARRGGGFSGGSFRGGGGYATGPRGGAVAVGPRGGTAYRAPYHGPGYRPAYRPGYGGVAAGVAVGAVVATLPARAVARSVAGQTYYYDGSNYYQPCYQGTDVSYCVVSDPNK
jgi:uncharacterized membrane protein